ncbi:MAG: COX15/CtaA family protein [Bacteroidetes bacterium]|nr:COX15/CtaA family protein [Bacteroidota bacterium]
MSSATLDKKFLQLAGITLVLLYLVITAGSVVRATGSGMGCPDWPKCFGYYIPPTNPSQVEFHENQSYKKGMMIIVNDTLWRATSDFTSEKSFNHSNWEKYPVHDYAKFFVRQTWTEYINRLIGATNALALTLLLVIALMRIKKDKQTFFVLIGGMCVMAFVIWLGAVVVNTNLAPQKITFHMMSSLALLSVVIFAHTRVSVLSGKFKKSIVEKNIRLLLFSAILLTITQIIFGTQVRQQIDMINHNMDGLSREKWISQLNGIYPVHQIIAMLVIVLNGFLVFKLNKIVSDKNTKRLVFGILFVLIAEYAVGVFIHNFSIPAFAQPIHLILAMILFGIQFGLITRTKS